MNGGNRREHDRRKGQPFGDRRDRDREPRVQTQTDGSRPAPTEDGVAWVRDVMLHGNYRRLDQEAKRLGERLTDEASRTQLRILFGLLTRLPSLGGEALAREVAMLRPRVAYAAVRVRSFDRLRDVVNTATRVVEDHLAEPVAMDQLRRLVDLIEAILCYSLEARSPREVQP